MPQYYKIASSGETYSLDKSSGAAQKVAAIPNGAPTITWSGSGLPSELQTALTAKPVTTAPATPAAPVTTTTPVSTATPAAPVTKAAAVDTSGLAPGQLTQYNSLIAAGADPTAALNAAKLVPSSDTAAPTTHTTSNLPGAASTTLYDYYTSKGQTLPGIADRGALFATLGLGSSKDYVGSATQNEELLSSLQRRDQSNSTIGSSTAPGASGSPAVDSTDAGTSLAKALAGGSASTTLENYKTYLASALGVAASKLSSDEGALSTFFGNEKSSTQILSDAMAAAGVTQEQSLLSDLDKQIQTQTTLLDKLPDDMRTTLQDVGVSQAQLDRLVLAASKTPTALLKDLLTQRNALSSEIDKATSFAEKFASTQIADQAARLAALEWMVTSDKGDYKDITGDIKSVITTSISQQKTIMTTALTAAKNGAPQSVIDNILGADTPEAAASLAGAYAVKPSNTPATSALTKDLNDIGGTFETGGSGYNGRGPDGFVDPYLYSYAYNYAKNNYGAAGVKAFFTKYPPAKNINPASVGQGILPPEIENAVSAKKKAGGGIG